MFQESIVIPKARQKWPLAFTAGLHVAVIGAILMMPPQLREAAEEVIKTTFFQEIAPPPPPPPVLPKAPPPPVEKSQAPPPLDIPVQPEVIPEKAPEQVTETPVLTGIDTGETEPGSGGGIGDGSGPSGAGLNVVGGDPEPGILYVGGKVKRPTAISQPQPVYTEVGRRTRTQGLVILEAVINREGHVEEIRVLKPLGYGLTESAVDAVRKWRFSPATLDDKPVAVYYTLTVNFRLN